MRRWVALHQMFSDYQKHIYEYKKGKSYLFINEKGKYVVNWFQNVLLISSWDMMWIFVFAENLELEADFLILNTLFTWQLPNFYNAENYKALQKTPLKN